MEDLVRETGEVVAVGEGCRVVDTAGKVRPVHTCESVDLAGVAAELEGVGVGGVANGDVAEDVLGAILGCGRTAVPMEISKRR